MATKNTPKSHDSDIESFKGVFEQLLKLIGINADVDITVEEDSVIVDIKNSEQAGLLIGARGKTLNSIQFIAKLIFNKVSKKQRQVLIDVGGYRKKEEDRLIEIAHQAAKRAVESGQTQNLYNLTPSQRRIIHLALSNDKQVSTESVGEGVERHLTITPKKS
jgi:spoIIIJ-associated protein